MISASDVERRKEYRSPKDTEISAFDPGYSDISEKRKNRCYGVHAVTAVFCAIGNCAKPTSPFVSFGYRKNVDRLSTQLAKQAVIGGDSPLFYVHKAKIKAATDKLFDFAKLHPNTLKIVLVAVFAFVLQVLGRMR